MAFTQYLGIAGTVVGAVIGAVIGAYTPVGPYTGAYYGAMIGGMAGGIAQTQFPEKPDTKSTPPPQPRENRIQVSSYGSMIPEVEGAKRYAGNIIFAGPEALTETRSRHRQDGVRYYENERIYTRTLVVLFCKGPISGISRLWVDNETFVDFRDADGAYFPPGAGELAQSNLDASEKLAGQYFRVYYGSEDQLPDPTYEALRGAGMVPAFRGWCYIVFPDFPIGKFGTLPNIEAELVAGAATPTTYTQIIYPADAYLLNLRGAHEFTPDGNFVGMHWTIAYDDYGGGQSTTATVYLFNKFSKQITRSSPILKPAYGAASGYSGYPPAYTKISRVISGWAVDPVTGQLWVGWSISYESATNIVGRECVFQIYSSPGGGLVRQWSEYSSGWTGKFSPKFYFVGDYLWLVSIVYDSGYCQHIEKRSRDGQHIYLSFNRIFLTINNQWDSSIYSTDGEYFYIWSGLPPYGPIKFLPEAIRIENGIGKLYPGDYTVLDDLYSGDSPTSWAGWWPPAGAANAAYQFSVFEDKYFVAYEKLTGAGYHILIKDPADPAAFVDAWTDDSAIRKRSPVSEQVANLAAVFSKYCLAAGLDVTQIDAAALAADSVIGYGITRQTPARTIIEPLALPFQFDVAEIDWQLRAVKRGAASVVTIPDAELAAVPYGSAPIDRLNEVLEQEIELPTHLTLTYEDKNRDYDLGSEPAVRVDRPHYVPMTLASPLVMTATIAKQTAEITLASYYLGRRRYKGAAGPKYIEYAPTDVVTVAGKDMRLTSVAWRDGVVEFAALAEEGGAYTSAAQAQDIGFSLPDLNRYTYIPLCVLMELPALSALDDTAGLYAAMFGQAASYRGGTLQRSTDGGASFSDVAYFGSTPAVAGSLTATLGTGLQGILDYTSSISVDLAASGGSLASATDEELAGGANLVAVGAGNSWELLQFKTATLVTGSRYTLTGLMRGLRGTGRFIATHGQGESLVKLNGETGIQNIGVDTAAIGVEYLYRIINPDGLSGETFVFASQGIALKPLPVANVTGTRNASGDLAIAWKRADRFEHTVTELPDYAESEPVSESPLAFEVDIIHPLFASVLRTLTAAAVETVTYTAAQIAADAYPKKRVDDNCSGTFSDNFLDKSWPAQGAATFTGDRLRLACNQGGASNAEINRSFTRSGIMFVGFTVHPKNAVALSPYGPNDYCVMLCKSSPSYNYAWAVQGHPEVGVGNNSCLSLHFMFDNTSYLIELHQRIGGSNTKLATVAQATLNWHTGPASLTWKLDFTNHTLSLYSGATLLVDAVGFSSSIDAQLTSDVAVVFHQNEYSTGYDCVGEFDDIKIYNTGSGPFPVYCDLYQLSAAVGRGLPVRAYL